MASETKTSIMTVKVENGKNGEPMEVLDEKPRHVSGESDSEEEYHEPGMRVGEDYQAMIPAFVIDKQTLKTDRHHNALLVWSPADELAENRLDDYLQVAKDKHGYNVEQALGMLFWHKHNVERSLSDLPNFTPFPDEWSMEDKVLFEQAFSSHGKSFKRIQQTLPDKSISSLVKYYYSWKKTRSRTSLIDRQAKRLALQQQKEQIIYERNFPKKVHSVKAVLDKYASDPESENSDSSDSDFEPEKERQNGQAKRTPSKNPQLQLPAVPSACGNCEATTTQLHTTPKGALCNACYQYWRRTGTLRPQGGGREEQTRGGHKGGRKRKTPKQHGMLLNEEQLLAVANTHGDVHTRPLEMEIVNLKCQIQNNKQSIGHHKLHTDKGIEDYRPLDQNIKNNSRWTNEELLLSVQAVRKYGKDFQAMAEVLGNKSVSQCRNFFVNYRRRFNLQQVLEEWEAEQGITSSDKNRDFEDDDLMEVQATSPTGSGHTSPNPSPPINFQGLPSQPPPLLKPTGSQSQRPGLPPLQSQGIPRTTQASLLGPPPLIKPSRPQMQPQMMDQKPLIGQSGMQARSDSPHSNSGTPPTRQTRSSAQ